MNDGLIAQFIDFVSEIFAGLDSGYLFFGGPLDIVRYIFDVLLITVLLYQLLKLVRETRAWQLLQGLFLIILFTLICSLFGLEMVSFLFNSILYVVAIAFVVIFQPELRRALETVGLKSFSTFSSAFSQDYPEAEKTIASMINNIVRACSQMAKTNTGALIIIERNSKLGELLEEENVVLLDSSVTAVMLESIFYKGSPLHDGAVLIRNGRIAAARCHVPLSESVHALLNFGTRHRAAVGASQMGDAIAIAVSEERGKISLGIDGCLYEMRSGDELKKNLFTLFGLSSLMGRLSRRFKNEKTTSEKDAQSSEKEVQSPVSTTEVTPKDIDVEGKIVAVSGVCSTEATDNQSQNKFLNRFIKTPRRRSPRTFDRMNRSRRILYMIFSFVISLGLWMYIQINNNPVVEKDLSLPLLFESVSTLEDNNLDTMFDIEEVQVVIVGRANVLDNLTASDIQATVDYSSIDSAGVYTIPVTISSEKNVYYRVETQDPDVISVAVFAKSLN